MCAAAAARAPSAEPVVGGGEGRERATHGIVRELGGRADNMGRVLVVRQPGGGGQPGAAPARCAAVAAARTQAAAQGALVAGSCRCHSLIRFKRFGCLWPGWMLPVVRQGWRQWRTWRSLPQAACSAMPATHPSALELYCNTFSVAFASPCKGVRIGCQRDGGSGGGRAWRARQWRQLLHAPASAVSGPACTLQPMGGVVCER